MTTSIPVVITAAGVDFSGVGGVNTGGINGLIVEGDSYGADMLNKNGTLVPYGSTVGGNGDRFWPHILRRKYGFDSNRKTVTVPGAGSATADITYPIDVPGGTGALRSASFSPFNTVTGVSNTNTRTLYIENSQFFGLPFAQIVINNGVTMATSVTTDATNFTRTFNVGSNLTTGNRLLYWLSAHANSGALDGDGGVLSYHWNGGPYSNLACVGSPIASSDPDFGGHGEIDNYYTHIVLRGGTTDTAVQTNYAGKIDDNVYRKGIPVAVRGYNDLTFIMEQAAQKECLRHVLSAHRWVTRHVHGSATMVENNGGVGTFATDSSAPYVGYKGNRRYYSGAAGATKTYSIPSNFNGETIEIPFWSVPARTETITVSSFASNVATLSGAIPNYSVDDIGRPIAWTGSPTDMTITDSTHVAVPTSTVTTGSKSALIGRGGGTATITIDGAAPTGGVTINGGTSGVVNTDQVVKLLPRISTAPLGADDNAGGHFGKYCHYIPVVKRIKGLAPGAHTITVTITSMAIGPSRFYFNGWARETDCVDITANVAVTPSMGSTDIANVPVFNGWTDDILAEFDHAELLDLHEILSPGGTPDPAKFLPDGVHPSIEGNADIADGVDSVIGQLDSSLIARS